LGITLLAKKKAPPQMKMIKIIRGRIIRNKDIPAAFMDSSSKRSPKLPKDIKEASKMANGSAMGTSVIME
jgi:hypothetical protein